MAGNRDGPGPDEIRHDRERQRIGSGDVAVDDIVGVRQCLGDNVRVRRAVAVAVGDVADFALAGAGDQIGKGRIGHRSGLAG